MLDLNNYISSINPFSNEEKKLYESTLKHNIKTVPTNSKIFYTDIINKITNNQFISKKLRNHFSENINVQQIKEINKSHFECQCKIILFNYINNRDFNESNLNMIHNLVTMSNQNLSEVRKINISNPPDEMGNFTIFPDFKHLNRLIEAKLVIFHEQKQKYPLLAAVFMMASVLAIHPFIDGNGRTSRIMFNLLIQPYLRSPGYIPLYEATYVSKGGWMMALRRAWLYNDFGSLVSFIAVAMKACR